MPLENKEISYLLALQHNLTIIEIDGIYTEKTTVETVYLAVAQRYGVLLKTKPDASQNYAMLGSLDTTRFDKVPGYLLPNVTGYLVYDSAKPLPAPPTLNDFNIIDDFNIVPLDRQPLLPNPDQTITLELNFTVIENQNRYSHFSCSLAALLTPISEPHGTMLLTLPKKYQLLLQS